MKNSKFFYSLIALALCITLSLFAPPQIATAEIGNNVMTEQLIEKLATIESEDKIDIVLWHFDIDYSVVEKETYKQTNLTEEKITDDLGIATIQNYIRAKRSIAIEKYDELNSNFSERYLSESDDIEIIFQSRLAPVFIVSATKNKVLSFAKNKEVLYIDIFKNNKLTASSDVANLNTGAAYLRDTSSINATGEGVIIGQVEPGLPYSMKTCGAQNIFNAANLSGNGVSPDATLYGQTYQDHAALVAAIMIGQPISYNNVTYKGIVPDAVLSSAFVYNERTLYNYVEFMVIDSNVNIINMSANFYDSLGVYDSISKWIDHLAVNHKTLFVVSSGNKKPRGDGTYINPNLKVVSPAMAYNAIAVGALGDYNETLSSQGYSYAPSTLSNQLLPDYFMTQWYSGYKTDNGAYKPDLMSYGTEIAYGDIFLNGSNANGNTGTSFAAPQVTGLIAQLCQLHPSNLVKKPALIKAVLSASAVYRAFNTNGDDTKDANSELFLMQGSGVENARCANSILNGNKYKELTIAGNTHYSLFTINIPSSYSYLRLSMAWLKNNSINYDEQDPNGNYTHLEYGTSNPQLADLRLELYKGSVSNSNLVAYSDTANTNTELLQYTIPSGGSGTYVVRVVNKSYTDNLGSQSIALAWY